jgi:hypothetical protein
MKVNLTDQIKSIIKPKPNASRFAILFDLFAINRQKYRKPLKRFPLRFPKTYKEATGTAKR